MVDLLNFQKNHDLTMTWMGIHNEAPMEEVSQPSQRAELEARQLREKMEKTRFFLWLNLQKMMENHQF